MEYFKEGNTDLYVQFQKDLADVYNRRSTFTDIVWNVFSDTVKKWNRKKISVKSQKHCVLSMYRSQCKQSFHRGIFVTEEEPLPL